MSDSTTNIKGGKIILKETKRGLEFHAFNFQRQRILHIGTLNGQTYEKVAPILRQPEPSFSLPQHEFGMIQETGAGFIRIIPPDKTMTYVISVQDFQKHAQPYHNITYGPQLRVPLGCFLKTSKVEQRNPIIDNPVIATAEPIGPKVNQMSLFSGLGASPQRPALSRRATEGR